MSSSNTNNHQGPVDLTLLKGMYHTADASYLSGNRQGCLRGTRKGVLRDIEHWLAGDQKQQIFWLNGLAGTGKSTISQTFAERMFADGRLGASFFCSRDFVDRSNLQAIFPTLAFQLAYQYPLFRGKLLQVLRAHPDVRQESLCSQMEKLIAGPLKTTGIPTLIIIDALDECKDDQPASAILSILSRYVKEIPNVKFFITGRPEPRIRTGFRLKLLLPITEVLKLHDVKPEAVNNDIKLFFQTQLTELAEERSDCSLTEGWPSPSEIKILCEKAAGFFIYAATAIKFIMSESHTPTQQLNHITSLPHSTSHEGRSGLDILYIQVLKQAVNDMDAGDEEFCSHFRTVVGAVLLVFNPLSVKALSDLLGVSGISAALRSLHSVLLVPTSKAAPVRIFHKSFLDFLVDPRRCIDHQFLINPSSHHREILLSCLNLMRERLKKNICGLDNYTVLSEVEGLPGCQEDHIGGALEYACCFWTKHLLGVSDNGPGVEEVQEAIDKFFTTCLLFWIEVLSLVKKLDIGVYALNDIQQWYTLVSFVNCLLSLSILIFVKAGISCKWTYDSQRLLLEWFDVIHSSPSQMYHIALPFCPPTSWIYKCYASELSQEVKVVKGLPLGWGTCLRTATLGVWILSMTCWKDTIAAGLGSGDIVTLDGITGIRTAILPGHTDRVDALAFLPDGTSLVSGSNDKTIKLWDVQTGGLAKTFYGHTATVWSVSISANCTVIASGSSDKTIRLWDIQTEECHCVIEQQDMVYHVVFYPPDPQHLMFVSGDKVWYWDISQDQTHHTDNGSCIAFSSDGAQFISCQGKDILVHNPSSGATVAEFCVANSSTRGCCFSPDGKLIAVAAGHIAYVYDITSPYPHPSKAFIGHTDHVSSLAFSSPSSLISSSTDGSVKFWQIGSLQTGPALTDPKSTPLTSAEIKTITLQAEDGIAISSDSEGMVRTWDILTGHCKMSFQTPAKGPEYSDIQLIDSGLILVWYLYEKIYIWDVEKERPCHTIDVALDFGDNAHDVKISGDGSKVFCLSWSAIKAWSILTGEAVGEVGFEFAPGQTSLSVNGSKVWVLSPKSEPLVWDFGISGSPPVQLSNSPSLHHNKPKLWDIKQSRIIDTVTGKVALQLAGRFAGPTHSQWDGQYLVTGYKSGEVLILDFYHMFF